MQVIEKQYPEEKYMLTKRSVIFTQSSATLDYEFKPVPGWFITQTDMFGEVKLYTLLLNCNNL